ncbi:MAG: polymerase, sigma-24 subunit, subfamily, partial [Verrucomicrobia bacterium]|nr:polymerase, sigma-24 subunit, subfamily [Verrucomicrobiota bacterium]
DAFAQLVRRWESPIRNLCVRMTGDLHKGQDLTQEAFVRVFEKRQLYQADAKFSTWLWRIALNLCYDEQRRIKRRGETALENEEGEAIVEPIADVSGPADQAEAGERAEMVRRALVRLPETYRTVLVLRHYEGLKFREIADVLDIPEGTVKSRMVEALGQMERLLKNDVSVT